MLVHVLEPHQGTRDLLLDLLRRAGHEPIGVEAFEAASRLIDQSSPALVLINLDTLDFHGPALLERIRSRQGGHDCTVVAICHEVAHGASSLANAQIDDFLVARAEESVIEARLAFVERRFRQTLLLRNAQVEIQTRQAALDRAEAALAYEQSLIKTVFDGAPDLFWVKDRDLRLVRANPATAAICGVDSAADLIGKSDHDLLDLAAADAYRARELAVLETGVPMVGVLEEHVPRNGIGRRSILSTKFALRGANGEVIGLVGMLRDISDRIDAERRIAASEARFRKMIQHSSDYLLIVDAEARVTWMSPSVERGLGRVAERRIGSSVLDHVAAEDADAARALLRRALAQPGQVQSMLAHFIAGNGATRAVFTTVTNLIGTEVDGIVMNGRDVTEMLQAQDALRESQESVRVALRAAQMAPWRYEIGAHQLTWTRETAERFGLPRTRTAIDLTVLSALIHPDDRRLFSRGHIARCVDEGQIDWEFRVVRGDGSLQWLHAIGQPARDRDGRPIVVSGVVFDITPRKEIEASLHAERAILDVLVSQSPDAVDLKDRESRHVRANQAAANQLGLIDPSGLIGKTDSNFFPAAIAEERRRDEQQVMRTGAPLVNRLDRHPFDGGERWMLTSLAPVRDEQGGVTGVIGTSRDVTAHNRQDRDLVIAETRYKLVVEAIPAITCLYSVINGAQSYEFVSPQVEQILGFTPEEMARLWSTTPELAVHPDDRERFAADVARLTIGHGSVTLEYRHLMKRGGWKWVRELVSPLPGDSAEHRRRQSILFDLTEDRALTERLEHQVFHDALTGLPNRALLSKRLDEALTRSSSTLRPFALLFVDIDGFKTINDSMGHHVGDAALIAVAERLRHLTRTGDTVARFGGDEFIVLLSEISGASDVNEVAARVQRAFLRPFEVDGASIGISPSIGISVHARAEGTTAEMLREADAAMYAAKRAGRGQTRIFDPAADALIVDANERLAGVASRK